MNLQKINPLTHTVGATLVVVLMFDLAPAAASPKDRESAPITCTGTDTTHYAPPLRPIPQASVVTVIQRLGNFSNNDGTCTGPFAGAHSETVFVQQASCLLPPEGIVVPPDVITYYWNNGGYSTITFSSTAVISVPGATIVTKTGTVTEGFNEGAPATSEIVVYDLDLEECLESGVDRQQGPMHLKIGVFPELQDHSN